MSINNKNMKNKPLSSNSISSHIKVMVIEDSFVKQKSLTNILESDESISVIETVRKGEDALLRLEKIQPNLITIDLNLPGINGFETAKKILSNYSIPIIIITSSRNKENGGQLQQKMKNSGSLLLLDSPPSPSDPHFKSHSYKIIRMVKLLSKTKMLTRHRRGSGTQNCLANQPKSLSKKSSKALGKGIKKRSKHDKVKLVAIGISTGGPTLLNKILSALPENYPLPILLVQHISKGFDHIFISYLKTSCKMEVKIAEHNEKIKNGVIYIAPGSEDMKLISKECLHVGKIDNNKILHPSVSELFG